MKTLNAIRFCAVIAALSVGGQVQASEHEKTYLARLGEVQSISGNGDENLYLLIREASVELESNWSPELAKELARVFDALLDVNQNHFLTELLMPMSEIRADQFDLILDSTLSPENRALYEELVQMVEDEEREGNG
ncbi:hypothetical protein [Celeribacter sp.]|uniref:hypothetical protein n=1 Tax=Celeribacter sp. TaxID=1890673 RepID=UPI003A9377DF